MNFRPIGYGEGDEEARKDWGDSKVILKVEFSNKICVFGHKDDKYFTDWAFNFGVDEDADIISTTLLTQAEAQEQLNK